MTDIRGVRRVGSKAARAPSQIPVDSSLEESLSQIVDQMPNLVSEAESLERERLEKAARPELSRIAQLILQMDARAISPDQSQEEEIKAESRRKLAASLGCTADDLQGVVDSYGENYWQELILEERVRHGIASTDMRDITWDRLESATLKKLLLLVDANKVSNVDELLRIATAANRANRGLHRSTPPAGGVNVQQNNVYLPGNPDGGILPGGNLGRIHLNLAPRVVKQIEGSRGIDMTGAPEFETSRKLDSIEMLNLKEVQKAIAEVESEK